MNRRSSALWRWRRAIAREEETRWTSLLAADVGLNWMIVEKPGRARLSLEAYFSSEKPARQRAGKWRGRVERVAAKPPPIAGPLRIDSRLEIAHDESAKPAADRLVIPYGMAFGSGEHATTLMLLRALARRVAAESERVLDLGTGSGVLALAARLLGARQVAAADFDPHAIRTARANERLNFASRRVRWEVADVAKLRTAPTYTLIFANLFSGVLIMAAPRIARALARGGELWLSGVLRSQQEEVAAAYRAAGLHHLKTTTRGKWVMQQWANEAGPSSASAD